MKLNYATPFIFHVLVTTLKFGANFFFSTKTTSCLDTDPPDRDRAVDI